jgi:hypothetical protein
MAKAQRYFITIDDLSRARGSEPSLAFRGESPATLAIELQAALRDAHLWDRWRSLQEDPELVDPLTGATDVTATVTGELAANRTELQVTTVLPHALIKHRLDLLVGPNWKLRDVS